MNKRLYHMPMIVAVFLLSSALAQVSAHDGAGPPQTGLRLDAPLYALHGPYWVGTREFVIEPESDRPLPVTAWYPALNPEGLAEAVSYPIDYPPTILDQSVAGHALLDAAVDLEHGPYPLVIFSHGLWVFRTQSVWYTEHLASYGFVVMAVEHTGDTEAQRNTMDPGGFYVYRPLDITRTIDFAQTLAAEGGPLAGTIDLERVAVTGHSFGGYTALAAAGGHVNYAEVEDIFCGQPGMEGLCPWLSSWASQWAEIGGLEAVPESVWPSFGDARVDAIIPLAPGPTYVFGLTGLETVQVPVLQIVGSADTLVPPELGAYWAHDHVGSSSNTLVIFENANHTIFENACVAAPWLEVFRCADQVWDFDRAHDLINHFATAFLLAELYGDGEAAAALAPEALRFPGITYETTGF